MAKTKSEAVEEVEVTPEVTPEVTAAPVLTDRELRWAEFLERHKKQSPEKHAARMAAGELNRIPDSFL